MKNQLYFHWEQIVGCKNSHLFKQFLNINFLKCPVGFTLTEIHSCCSCIGGPYFTCNLDSGTITKSLSSLYWIGYDTEFTNSVVVGLCAYDYCKSGHVIMNTSSSELDCNIQCQFGRIGILCGQCPNGSSAIIGGSHCWKCGNKFISLAAVFAVGGLLLVLIIAVLDITVSHGTIILCKYYSYFTTTCFSI